MSLDSQSDNERPVVNMVGSSTVKDLQGDTMLLSALDDMTKIPDNLTILLNHSMEVPESIFGGLHGRPWIKASAGIADLHLSSEVETLNPRAMQTYAMISRGRRLGCSIGCLVLDYRYDEGEDTLEIVRVLPVEYSVVSVPAQQRCWVEVAAKSLFERSLLEGRGDDALRLAPAIKGMFWKTYESIVKHVESTGLKADLERIVPRNTASHRIIYDFTDSTEGFALVGSKGAKKSLSREEVGVLIEKSVVPMTPKTISDDALTKEDSVSNLETKDIADTQTDSAINRQDLGEEEDMRDKAVPKASEIVVDSDGNHDTCTGSHSHAHKALGSQGDDETHTHDHNHDGDASHKHSHSEKAIEPTTTKTPDENDVTPTLVETPNNTEVSVVKEGGVNMDILDPQKTMLHEVYKSLIAQASAIGAQIGIEPIILDKAIMPVNMNPQDVISTISSIDAQVDMLMEGFGIPDIDDDDEQPVTTRYSIESQVTKALEGFFVVKEGKEHSKGTLQKLQMIHDCVKSMHPGACEGDGVQHQTESTTQDEANERARQDDQMKNYQAGIDRHVLAIDSFTKSLESIGVNDLVDTALSQALQEARSSIASLRKEQSDVVKRLDTLKTMPLGRPTTFVGRTVEPDENTASYADMLSSKGTMTYEDAVASTKIVARHGMKYRAWSDGVGGDISSGVRPRLTEQQKTFMAPQDIIEYNEGRAAMVPMFDEVTV